MSLTSKQEAGVHVYVGNYGTYELPPELYKTDDILKSPSDGRTKLGKLIKQWGQARDLFEKELHEANL